MYNAFQISAHMTELLQKKATKLFPASIDNFHLSAKIEDDRPWEGLVLYIYAVRPASTFCPIRQVAVSARFDLWGMDKCIISNLTEIDELYGYRVDALLQELLIKLLDSIHKLYDTEGGDHECMSWETHQHI